MLCTITGCVSAAHTTYRCGKLNTTMVMLRGAYGAVIKELRQMQSALFEPHPAAFETRKG